MATAIDQLAAMARDPGTDVAGGIGNAIDRFTLGFVVDFIEPTFIDFPIFNIADIGVTCGIILFIVSLLIHERTEAKRAARGSENGGGE